MEKVLIAVFYRPAFKAEFYYSKLLVFYPDQQVFFFFADSAVYHGHAPEFPEYSGKGLLRV